MTAWAKASSPKNTTVVVFMLIDFNSYSVCLNRRANGSHARQNAIFDLAINVLGGRLAKRRSHEGYTDLYRGSRHQVS